MPGAYGEVHLHLNTGMQTLVVPVPTMIFQSAGLQVATVVNGKVRLQPIQVGQDDGKIIQVVSGLNPDDEVIQNPPDSILDGQAVHIVQPNQQSGAAAGGNSVGSGKDK